MLASFILNPSLSFPITTVDPHGFRSRLELHIEDMGILKKVQVIVEKRGQSYFPALFLSESTEHLCIAWFIKLPTVGFKALNAIYVAKSNGHLWD